MHTQNLKAEFQRTNENNTIAEDPKNVLEKILTYKNYGL